MRDGLEGLGPTIRVVAPDSSPNTWAGGAIAAARASLQCLHRLAVARGMLARACRSFDDDTSRDLPAPVLHGARVQDGPLDSS